MSLKATDTFFRAAMAALQTRQFSQAEQGFRLFLQHHPRHVGALNMMAFALAQQDKYSEALTFNSKILKITPTDGAVHANHAHILRKLGRLDKALAAYNTALTYQPQGANIWRDRSVVLRELARPEEALASCDMALKFGLKDADLLNNRGMLLQDLNRLQEALAAYDAALKLQPDHAGAHRNRSTILLLQGQFEQGLAEYEWRSKAYQGPKFDIDPRYLWLGQQDLRGKILFIHPELYLGDMLQFCRYGLLAEAEGAHVVIAAPAVLHRVLRSLSPTIEVIEKDARPPRFDFYCPLMSLPLAFYRRLPAFPARIPYLAAETARVQVWKERIGVQGFKIGICWQGSTASYAAALRRSFPLLQFQGLGRIPGVRLISLQKNDGLEQLSDLPPSMQVETLGEDFDAGADAFLDTAAVMETLDLIITADTAVAHLAGALGRPTWVALPDRPDWRWMLERSDSPWYPTMRLFRQATREGWADVFLAMEQALRDLLAQKDALHELP